MILASVGSWKTFYFSPIFFSRVENKMKRMSKHERLFFFCFYSWRLQASKTLVRPVGEKTNKQTSREDGWGGEHITFLGKGGGAYVLA
jgi:hypothetical protein